MGKPDAQFPTSGGSYTRKPSGTLDQVEATKPPPSVQVTKPDPSPATPAPTPADKNKKE